MGWTAPSAPKHNDLGEMPGVRREITDEERERMNNNDPNQDNYTAILRNLDKREKEVAEQLVNTYGQTAMDVANFIERWNEEIEEAYEQADEDDDLDDIDVNLFDDDLYDKIKERLKKTGDTFDPNDVYDIYLRRELSPEYFFYGVNVDSTTGECYAVITRMDLWHEYGKLDDKSFSKYVAPEFLSNPQDSRYDVVGDMTPSEVRRALRKLGFVERLEVAGL